MPRVRLHVRHERVRDGFLEEFEQQHGMLAYHHDGAAVFHPQSLAHDAGRKALSHRQRGDPDD